nr:uncharacterized protein LOC102449859 isoform X3 [Pelodiscus sinensis]|eukprot:XP_025043387.1 uncharacterized protein LOC102449859 isoform X3 [Pelodiscus sinensis]
MLLSLCLLLPVINPSSQKICLAPGALPAPTLYLNQTSAQQGDSVRLKCSVVSQSPATRVFFCKDGEEILSETGLEKKITYNYDHAVSRGSSGNYSCGYEIQDSDNRVNRSQLSPAKHLSVTALGPSSKEICSAPGSLPAPTLHLSQTSAQPGDSVRLQCSVLSQFPTTRIVFCEDGEEVSSQRGLLGKLTYDSHHVVTGGSSGDYSCGYEIKDSDNRVNGSQLSPAQHLSVSGALPAPTLHLNQTSARPGDSVRLQCSLFSWARATRIVFYKNGEEVSSQSLLRNLTYDYDHVVSGGSSGNYSCAYEIKDNDNRVIRSQFSPAQHLRITGTRPAPILYLNQTSAQPGDSVRLQCSLFSWDQPTRIIFYKDGEEVSSQRSLSGILTYDYDHVVSEGSSGNYSCAYEIKDSNNRVTRSQLSAAKHLSVTGPDLKLLLGITVPAVLVLAVALYLLGRKAVSLRREHRERVQHDTSNASEDSFPYSSVDLPESTRHPLQTEENPIYMNIALEQGNGH